MTIKDDGTRPDEWIRLLERACNTLRSKIGTPPARAAIDWFNTEYAEAAVRARREAFARAPLDTLHRRSARQIPGADPGSPTEVWRLSAALIDLRTLNPSFGFQSWEDDSERRCNAFMVLLMVALVADREAHQYLGKDIELARLSIGGEGDQMGRGFASNTAGFDDGEESWPTLVRRAIEEVEAMETRDDTGIGRTGSDCKDIQGKLLSMRERGEPYTSGRKLAAELGCSERTIRKAIKNSATLKGWKARSSGRKTAPKATDLGAMVSDNTRQKSEPDPADTLLDEDVDATMARLIDQARPNERARLNALDHAERRALVAVYQEQYLDQEPSPLNPDKPGERTRRVVQRKRA